MVDETSAGGLGGLLNKAKELTQFGLTSYTNAEQRARAMGRSEASLKDLQGEFTRLANLAVEQSGRSTHHQGGVRADLADNLLALEQTYRDSGNFDSFRRPVRRDSESFMGAYFSDTKPDVWVVSKTGTNGVEPAKYYPTKLSYLRLRETVVGGQPSYELVGKTGFPKSYTIEKGHLPMSATKEPGPEEAVGGGGALEQTREPKIVRVRFADDGTRVRVEIPEDTQNWAQQRESIDVRLAHHVPSMERKAVRSGDLVLDQEFAPGMAMHVRDANADRYMVAVSETDAGSLARNAAASQGDEATVFVRTPSAEEIATLRKMNMVTEFDQLPLHQITRDQLAVKSSER